MATYKGRLNLADIVRPDALGEVDLYRTGTVQNSNTRDDSEVPWLRDALYTLREKLAINETPNPNDWEVLIIAYRDGEDGLEIAGTRG